MGWLGGQEVGSHLVVLGVAVWGEAAEYLEVPVRRGPLIQGCWREEP